MGARDLAGFLLIAAAIAASMPIDAKTSRKAAAGGPGIN